MNSVLNGKNTTEARFHYASNRTISFFLNTTFGHPIITLNFGKKVKKAQKTLNWKILVLIMKILNLKSITYTYWLWLCPSHIPSSQRDSPCLKEIDVWVFNANRLKTYKSKIKEKTRDALDIRPFLLSGIRPDIRLQVPDIRPDIW